jgi:AcrR family transcriptional regulator
MPTVTARRTQAERTASTQARLLDATIETLAELGWAQTTTTEVVRRAGVSRGAQVHHYPTKDDLVLAAMDHLMVVRQHEFDAAFAQLPAEQQTPQGAVDLLWDACFGSTFDAWLELALAARRSPTLRERFLEMEHRWTETTTDRFQQLFPTVFGDRSVAAIAMRLTFSILDGLAICRIAGADGQLLADTRAAFNAMSATFLPTLEA